MQHRDVSGCGFRVRRIKHICVARSQALAFPRQRKRRVSVKRMNGVKIEDGSGKCAIQPFRYAFLESQVSAGNLTDNGLLFGAALEHRGPVTDVAVRQSPVREKQQREQTQREHTSREDPRISCGAWKQTEKSQ